MFSVKSKQIVLIQEEKDEKIIQNKELTLMCQSDGLTKNFMLYTVDMFNFDFSKTLMYRKNIFPIYYLFI